MLDTGARGSTVTFVERGIGDVLGRLGERGLPRRRRNWGRRRFEIVVPPRQHPGRAAGRGASTRWSTPTAPARLAEAYLQYPLLAGGSGDRGQELLPPAPSPTWRRNTQSQFPKLDLFTFGEKFGTWREAQKKFFNDGGIFDEIYQPGS